MAEIMMRLKKYRFTWPVWSICIASCIVTTIMLGRTISGLGEQATIPGILREIAWALYPIVLPFLSALIITRQPRNTIGWLMMLHVIYFPVAIIFSEYLKGIAAAPIDITYLDWLVAWFDMWIWIPFIFPIFFIALLFPTGRPPSPRWMKVVYFALGLIPAFLVLASFGKNLEAIDAGWSIPNPVGFIPDQIGEPILIIWQAGLAFFAVASVSALFVRYKSGSTSEQQQIKWLLFVFAALLPLYLSRFALKDQKSILIDILMGASLLAIPISITLAVLRYQLWNIDLLIRKTLVYSLLTGLLGLVYFGGVALMQNSLTTGNYLPKTSSGQLPAIVIVIITLGIAALFNPLRQRIQDLIDRRFYRQKYDAEKALADFSFVTRNETNLPALTNSLVNVVQNTVQPEEVRLWLKS